MVPWSYSYKCKEFEQFRKKDLVTWQKNVRIKLERKNLSIDK